MQTYTTFILGVHIINTVINVKIKIYKATILPAILYGCKTWSLTLREEQD
jgi:hypothetical protein